MSSGELQQSTPGAPQDLEEMLTALRNEAEAGTSGGSTKPERSHPAVAFYCGKRAVRLQVVPDGTDISHSEDSTLYVISLHKALLPAHYNDSFSEEEHSLRLSSSEGLELLRTNWELLLWLLMPSVQISASCDPMDGADDSSPISSWRELCCPLTWEDYKCLRRHGVMDRVHYSYVVFLRFYGWRLHNEENGVLDRHRNWEARYRLLVSPDQCCKCSLGGGVVCDEVVRRWTCDDGVPCPYTALTRILKVLLELCFNRYAVNLVAFIIEEMSKGRLLFLQQILESVWFPIVVNSKQVADADRDYLSRKLHYLTHSDSD